MKKLKYILLILVFTLIVGTGSIFGDRTIRNYNNIMEGYDICMTGLELCAESLRNCANALENCKVTTNKIPVSVARVTVTCYNSDPKQTDSTPMIGAFNKKVGPGTVAVSRDLLEKGFIPFCKIWAEGEGELRVNDVMNERFKNTIDIWKPKGSKMYKRNNVLIVKYYEKDNEKIISTY